MNYGSAQTIPGSPYQVIITPPGGGTFVQDLGVLLASDGSIFKKVTGAPAAGEYSVSGATYTFNSGDTTKAVAISYLYSLTTGNKLTLSTAFGWKSPVFQMILNGGWNGRQMTMKLNSCAINLFGVPAAVEQFAVFNIGFEALSDASGNVGLISLA